MRSSFLEVAIVFKTPPARPPNTQKYSGRTRPSINLLKDTEARFQVAC
jgi:hypothetical protein